MSQTLLGKFTLPAYNFTVDATQKTTTADDYYLEGYTGEGGQLVEHLQTLIRTVSGKGSATVTFSHSTGKITINFGATTSLDWDDTALGTLLGYTSASYSGESSYTAENQARYKWTPSQSCSDFPMELDGSNLLSPESTTVIVRSKSGYTYAVTGELLESGGFRWDFLLKAEVKTPTTGTIYGDFQQFWKDVIHAGKPIRFIPDNSSYADTGDYVECICPGSGSSIGSFEDFEKRNVENINGFHAVTLPLYKFIDE